MNTYDSSQVSVIVGTTIVGDFESISTEQQEDGWTFDSGSSGDVSASKNSNRLMTATITTKQTKAVNLQLSALYEGDSIFPLTIKDNNGTSLHFIPQARIVKIPSAEYGKSELSDREWTIVGKATANVVGGNN